jgi:hypothetical protein
VLPFCSDETLDQLEKNLLGLPSMTQLLNQGLSPQQITQLILQDLGSSSTADAVVPRRVCAPCALHVACIRGRLLRVCVCVCVCVCVRMC